MLTIQEMLESGVHFGHQVQIWNPKMAPYIFGQRNGMHIINIVKTRSYLKKVCKFLLSNVNKNTRILFVGTKMQAAPAIELAARECSGYYVNQRWLGGLLTNWATMKTCIQKLRKLELQEKNSEIEGLSKKELAIIKKRKEKLERFFGGVKNMKSLPNLVILVGQPRELNAVHECIKLNIKTIMILDTNCDPSLADLFIPANDDSIKSISLILNKLSKTIILAKKKNKVYQGSKKKFLKA